MTATNKQVTADRDRLREVLKEKGLPQKLGAKLNQTEVKIHTILCSAYNFNSGTAELEIPAHVLSQCGNEFRKIWNPRPFGSVQGKAKVMFTLTPEAIKTTIKTTLMKDSGIFTSKVNLVPLHITWSQYIRIPDPKKPSQKVDWRKAERQAKRQNEQIKEAINDGKTFNAHKDNPWARKNLKNKSQ